GQRSGDRPRGGGDRPALVAAFAKSGRSDLFTRIPGEALLLMNFRRTVRSAVLLLVGIALPNDVRSDVRDYLGRPVTSVRFSIEGRDTVDPSLADLAETRVGGPLSMAQVRLSVSHLFSLGRFEDVRVDAQAAGAGVALVFELVPIHPVARIVFAGPLDPTG